MLYREIIAVCSQIHTKHINTLCGRNVEFVPVLPCGTYCDHWSLVFSKNDVYRSCMFLLKQNSHQGNCTTHVQNSYYKHTL